jgi:acyl dehydratase
VTRSLYDLPDSLYVSVRSRGRTINEGDFSAMTNLTWTFEEIHTDKVDTMQHRGTERMLAGACIPAFALGLATPAVKPPLEAHGILLWALVGYEEVRFLSPLFPDDTIYVESRLRSLETTSNPERGLARFDDVVVDAQGRKIMSCIRVALCDVSGAVLSVPATE